MFPRWKEKDMARWTTDETFLTFSQCCGQYHQEHILEIGFGIWEHRNTVQNYSSVWLAHPVPTKSFLQELTVCSLT